MRKFVFVALALFLSFYILGCGKKEASFEEAQMPVSMETLSALSTTQTAPEAKAPEVKPQTPITEAARLEPLPPSGPYKPTAIEIQAALKNAGFYIGEIDGRIGPLTRKATEEFQKANGLKADGKVGPQTWAILGAHLNPPETKSKKRR